MKNHQKTALITGGATGIGKQTALQLAAQGVNVVISGRRADVGAAAVADIQAAATPGTGVKFIQNDVRDEQAVQAMIDDIIAQFGRLDYAVNNAAISNETAPFADSDSQNFREMVDINILGVYYGMKHQIRAMLKQGGGAIVNLCSIAGLNGIPFAGSYAATKHAVVGMTKSAALDYAQSGIRINGIAPGATKTDIIATQLSGNDPNYNEAVISAMHPMNRLGNPQEIADGICFLLSDHASFITGHILSIDGGFQAK